jgi:hypothetical protein
MRRLLTLLLTTSFATACDRRDRFAGPDSSSVGQTPIVPARSAYLSVSDLSPARGATIVVTGTLKVSDSLSLGSFRVRLGYDSTKLRYLEEIPNADMMRVVNPQVGDIIVVGASSNPSADGRLFAFRFQVDDPAGVNSLVLRIDELNDTGFNDQRVTVRNAAVILQDRSLARLVPAR